MQCSEVNALHCARRASSQCSSPLCVLISDHIQIYGETVVGSDEHTGPNARADLDVAMAALSHVILNGKYIECFADCGATVWKSQERIARWIAHQRFINRAPEREDCDMTHDFIQEGHFWRQNRWFRC